MITTIKAAREVIGLSLEENKQNAKGINMNDAMGMVDNPCHNLDCHACRPGLKSTTEQGGLHLAGTE